MYWKWDACEPEHWLGLHCGSLEEKVMREGIFWATRIPLSFWYSYNVVWKMPLLGYEAFVFKKLFSICSLYICLIQPSELFRSTNEMLLQVMHFRNHWARMFYGSAYMVLAWTTSVPQEDAPHSAQRACRKISMHFLTFGILYTLTRSTSKQVTLGVCIICLISVCKVYWTVVLHCTAQLIL